MAEAAEQWKVLARTTTQALMESTAAQLLGPSFAIPPLTHRGLQLYNLANGGLAIYEIDLESPTEMIREALRALARYNDLHNRSARALSIYGGLLGVLVLGAHSTLDRRDFTPALLPAAGQVWRGWVQCRANALDYIHAALRRLRAVAVYDLATVDAFTVAQSFDQHSLYSIVWLRAAESLATRAEAEVIEANRILSEMYVAVRLECLYGLQITT